MQNINYPKQHENLLRKAGLLGTGYLEVKAIHRYKTQHISEDGMTFEIVKRPEIDDLAVGSTSAVFNQAGQIAGYWANGLTSEERRIINEECGVPYYYLNEPINPITGVAMHPDTMFTIREGQIFDLSNPKDVAFVRCISEVISTIGLNKQEAVDNNAMFYFFSQEEEKVEKQKVIKERKGAAKLVDELSYDSKHQIIKILSLDSVIPVDPFLSKDAAVEVFDELAFTMPTEVLSAYKLERKSDYICAKSLIFSGYIEAASLDGPYYKNPTIFGQKTHLADSLDELVVKIGSHSDMVQRYKDLEGIIKNDTAKEYYSLKDSSVIELFSKHGLYNESSDNLDNEVDNSVVTLKNRLKFLNIDQMLKLLDSENIEHNFDGQSNLKEVKEFYLMSHSL